MVMDKLTMKVKVNDCIPNADIIVIHNFISLQISSK